MGASGIRLALWSATTMLAGYLATVLLLDRALGPLQVSLGGVIAIAVGCGALVSAAVLRAARRGAARAHLPHKLVAAQVSTLAALLALDLSLAALRNARGESQPLEVSRVTDRVTWIGEVYPPLYWHEEGFRLAKPGYSFTAAHYGDAYVPALMASATLRDHVLSLKRVAMAIDAHGFRNGGEPRAARVFSLGDSFTFGWGVSDEETWSALLARRIGEPVYNLGVHDSSPLEEVVRLRHLLRARGGEFRPAKVVWLLFEGNDLEDCRPIAPARAAAAGDHPPLLAGTAVDLLLQIPGAIQRESVIDRLRRGDLLLGGAPGGRDPHLIDGVRSPHPVHHSKRFGWMLWLTEQVERAREPASYVDRHANRPRLEQAFAEMASLSAEYGFEVTVAIAPSAVRLYAPYVEDLDRPLAGPRLIETLVALSREAGFATVDLLDELGARVRTGETELLYFRDDDHWSPRGHALVAEVLAERLAARAIARRARAD